MNEFRKHWWWAAPVGVALIVLTIALLFPSWEAGFRMGNHVEWRPDDRACLWSPPSVRGYSSLDAYAMRLDIGRTVLEVLAVGSLTLVAVGVCYFVKAHRKPPSA